MGELAIQRNRGFAPVRAAETRKSEKSAAAGPAQKTIGKTGLTVSETLQELMTKAGQAEESARESHRTLQTGEVVLDEVRDSLERMAKLAQEAAGENVPDRAALQEELEQLRQQIDRILSTASAGGERLFLDGDMPPQAVSSSGSGPDSALPDWLLNGISQGGMTSEQILSSLGLDKNASVLDLLTAISGSQLESNSAAGHLAALYLGALISAGGSSGVMDAGTAAEGLRQLLEKVAQGISPDEAIALLTDGAFSGLSDFQSQFTAGVIPGLQDFLYDLLLSGSDVTVSLTDAALLALLPGGGGTAEMDLDFIMDLLAVIQTAEPDSAAAAADQAGSLENMGMESGAEDTAASLRTAQFGNVQVTGQDLSGVSYDEASGVLTIGGEANVTIQGMGQTAPAILLTGSGTVTLQDASVSVLTLASPGTQVLCAGESVLGEVRLEPNAVLTLGGGPVRIGVLTGGSSNALRLTAGASVMAGASGEVPGTLTVPVILDGPASLAAQAANVTNSAGKALDPFDVVWKVLLPDWSAITDLTLNGRQAKLALSLQDSARLWLNRGDPSHGSPVHNLLIRGRDRSARPKVRHAYLRWSQEARAFEEISLYPNPFTVTGGEPGRDWFYDEESQTLRILSDQVTAVSGGPGTDARKEPFSGRIALDDAIGTVKLDLDGVACRVAQGAAFRLGRENQVTLILQNGTRNFFESGPGCAGVSLGDGASLTVDRAASLDGGRTPPGALTASGKEGGAGIGRDSGAGRDQTSSILIRGGTVTVSGDGGGAGIGGGKRGAMGDVTITGGTVSASGNGGGAGIGGALNAQVGGITIQGGKITASATCHAAAIGAGVQGTCGDILITGTASILKALGGDPGADIGGCLFGRCGAVRISGAADIGRARLWTRPGVSLQMGEDTVTLPQFRLSAKAMRLDQLSLETQEDAQAAGPILEADRCWVAQIQEAYTALYNRLSQNGFTRAERYYMIRDIKRASELLESTARSIPLQPSQVSRAHGKRGSDWLTKLLLW